MAERKTANTQRDHWAVWTAVQICVEMIDCQALDKDGPRKIILEALEVAGWDDVVAFGQRSSDGTDRTLWQVKRQNVALNKETVVQMFRAMHALLPSCGAHDRFCFGTPNETALQLDSKVQVSFRTLRQQCNVAREPGLNSAAALGNASAEEQLWYALIADCIGDTSPKAIVSFLSRLEIHELGTEADLRKRATEKLRATYRNADFLVERIFSFLDQHSDGRLEIANAVLEHEVLGPYGVREPTRTPWLRATRQRPYDKWHISGPLAPESIVEATWPDGADPALLRVSATPQTSDDEAEVALMRLIAHRSRHVKAEISDPTQWERYIRSRTGGTLGFSPDSRDVTLQPQAPGLRSADEATVLPEQLAEPLEEAMDFRSWKRLKGEVDSVLADPARVGLEIEPHFLADIARLWRKWETTLDADAPTRTHFLRMQLATREEWFRSEFSRTIRLGERAIPAVAQAIVLALAIGTALATGGVVLSPTGDDGINLTVGSYAAHLVALSYASKPGSNFGLKITDAAGHFLSQETGCTILAGTETPPSMLHQIAEGQAVPYNVASAANANYQSSYAPKPILTNEPELRQSLAQGRTRFRAFLAERFRQFAKDEWAFLSGAVETPLGGGVGGS
jgi:hypothetical protein